MASPRPSIAREPLPITRQRVQVASGSQESQGSIAATAPRLSSTPEAEETARQGLRQHNGRGAPSRLEATRPLAGHAEPAKQESRAEGPDQGRDSRESNQPRMVLGMHTPTARPHGLSSTGETFGWVIVCISSITCMDNFAGAKTSS